MEDFDEADEQNEEDLMELGDSFANNNLKVLAVYDNNVLGPCARNSKRFY